MSAREGYAIWSSTYDQELNPLIATEEPRVKRLLAGLPRPHLVLDVATGTGRWALHCARQGVEVTALDQSPEMLAVAQQKAAAEGLPVTFVQGAIEDGLPFPDDHYDLVIFALALSHIPNIMGAIRECSRVLRPRGYLLITDFHPHAIHNGWEATVFRGEDAYILPHPRHTREAYFDAIAAADCDVVQVEEVSVREQDPATILASDVDAFIAEYGDWLFCLILLAQSKSLGTGLIG